METLVPIIGYELLQELQDTQKELGLSEGDLGLAFVFLNEQNISSVIKRDPLTTHIPVIIELHKGQDFSDRSRSLLLLQHPLFAFTNILVVHTSVSEFTSMIVEVYQQYSLWGRSKVSLTVRQALLYSYRQLSDCQLSIDTIAHYTCVSKHSLERVFKKELQQSVWQYIMDLRFREAARLLTTTAVPVSEIASAVGYDDISVFDRTFKRKYGSSPLKYRQAANTLH